jgi:hypothetical protein
MRQSAVAIAALSFSLAATPIAAEAVTKTNPICPDETVEIVTPIAGAHIQVPEGFRVEPFATELNFPTGIALRQCGHF